MRDFNFGHLAGRQLTIRLFAPGYFERWTEHSGIRFDPWRLINPLAWWKSIFRGRYDFWYSHCPGHNHRCYCPVGTMLDFSLVVAGWGFVVFYSYYGGEIPCYCDKVIAEIFGEEEDEVTA